VRLATDAAARLTELVTDAWQMRVAPR